MAAWCEGEHPPQSQRTMEPSGGEGKASTTAAAVTTRSAAKSVAPTYIAPSESRPTVENGLAIGSRPPYAQNVIGYI